MNLHRKNDGKTSGDKGKQSATLVIQKESPPEDALDPGKSPRESHIREEEGDAKSQKDDKHGNYDWFKVNADELMAKVEKRIEDLVVLQGTAQSTSSSVRLHCMSVDEPCLPKYVPS